MLYILFRMVRLDNLVKQMKLLRSSKRVNVLYFTPKDHKGNVFIIDPSNSTVVSTTYTTVVSTDFTVVSAFECRVKQPTTVITEEYIDCIFTTYGPYIFRVQLKEDPGTGLVEVLNSKLKGRYEMYFDNFAAKIISNDNYFAVVTTSTKSGMNKILLYKFLDKKGTVFLWSGISYEDYSNRPLTDIDLVLLPTDELVFLTNTMVTANSSLVKTAVLKEATIDLKQASISELEKYKLVFNSKQSDIEQSYVPLANLFLHIDEQSGTILFNSDKWYHWVLLIGGGIVVYGYLIYSWKREQLRRQKLREEILCSNLGDQLRV